MILWRSWPASVAAWPAAGQPVPIGPRTKKARFEGIYKIDSVAQIKRSNENPIIQSLYAGILKGKEHKLLHNEW